MRRRTFLAASGLIVALPPHAQSGGKLVHSVDELGAAIARAVPGTVITVARGTYEGSSAINAASRSYPDVARDLGGDHRTGRAADVGADEYSVRRPTYRPLTSTDVGPRAR